MNFVKSIGGAIWGAEAEKENAAAAMSKTDSEPVATSCKLYRLESSAEYVLQSESVTPSIVEEGDYEYVLRLHQGENLLLSQAVSSSMSMAFHTDLNVTWVFEVQGTVVGFSLVFPEQSKFVEFAKAFNRALYESNHRDTFDKVKGPEQDYLMGVGDDVYDVEEDVGDDDMEDFEEGDEESEGDTSAIVDSDDEDAAIMADATNKDLAVGTKQNRSFVVRGDRIGVYKFNDDHKLQFSTSIKNIATPGGDLFSPQKVMLHQEDTSMLLLHPEQDKNVFRLDLETGKVVEEWGTDDIRRVFSVCPDNKQAQSTHNSTFVAMNKNAIFRMDPRVSGKNKLVDSQTFQYGATTKPLLSCATTTGNGQIAVGNEKGEVRMFSQNGIMKRPKTCLPGLGDPITAIDTVEDGRWVLATTKSYLMVIPTEVDGVLGFEKSMGAKKPLPRKLYLSKEDIVRYQIKDINFTPAHFDLGHGQEKSIVTSTGNFVITWNFQQVKAGNLKAYKIKQLHDNVVMGQFRYGNDDEVVVTLPNDVRLARKKK